MSETAIVWVNLLVNRWDNESMTDFAYEVSRLYSTSDYVLISEVMNEFKKRKGGV